MESTSLQVQNNKQFEGAKHRLARLTAAPLERQIADEMEYVAVAEIITEAKKFRREWDEETKKIRVMTKQAHAEACRMFSDIDTPLEVLIRRGSPLLIDFENRKESERRAREEAINKQIAVEQAAMTPDVVEQVDAPPPLVVTLPKFTGAAGLSRRTSWRAEVKDLKALVKAVAAGKVPLSYIEPNTVLLNTQARAMKKDFSIPGVVAVEETVLAERAAR